MSANLSHFEADKFIFETYQFCTGFIIIFETWHFLNFEMNFMVMVSLTGHQIERVFKGFG